MKTKKYIALGLLAACMTLANTSCSDSFLEVTNPTGENLKEYYTTDEHINEALNAAYDPLHWPDWAEDEYSPLNLSEFMGDDFFVGGGTAIDGKAWHQLSNFDGSSTYTLTGLWKVEYTGVKRCNDLLEYLGWAADNLTEANAKSYEMQGRALRVYYYNNLWHYWGNIPFYFENLSAPYKAPQLKADEVYDRLITELEDIINSNVLPMRWDDDNCGRMSQAMCYMMYAEMVMYQNDKARYSTALQYMQQIIGDKNEYGIVDDYASIWKESGEWCKESIMEINYVKDNSERAWSNPLGIGGTILPTLIGPRDWTDGSDGLDAGIECWGFMPARPETYDMFSAADKRREATIWDTRGKEYNDNSYEHTGFWLAKYRPFTENNATTGDRVLNYNNNYRVYRVAEAYLNAAELTLETGGSAAKAAQDYVNPIRERAGLTGLASVSKDDILKERHLEFVGEGKRYFDLVRTGNAARVLQPVAEGHRTQAWTESKKYLPIPQSEIDSDPDLQQNNY